MKKHETRTRERAHRLAATRRGASTRLLLLCACCSLGGCTWDQLNPIKPPTAPPPPVQSFVLRDGNLIPEAAPVAKSAEAELAGAQDYYRREEYAKAKRLFHHIGNSEKNPASIVQEALYFEAECARLQGDLPTAADIYASLLQKQTIGPYRDLAIKHIYDICDYWLQDTWVEMREDQEKREGKRWVVVPRFVSFDKRKPLLDREGRAVERLKDISVYEAKGGQYADKALYLCGYIAWHNENYRDADDHFSELCKRYPDSPLANEAISLAIKAKLMNTGGVLYDGKKVHDARKLADDALRMPDLTPERKKELLDLLNSINLHQAESDYEKAEFYRRTGRPGSAYFCYEIVCRRYPGTETAERALRRKKEIYAKMAEEQRKKLGEGTEGEGRPTELLSQPRRVINQPETVPMPRPGPNAPEQVAPPRPLPDAQDLGQPRPLQPPGGGNN
jgi:outer membrane protein assembly factor BamD (BamD/ComL family)